MLHYNFCLRETFNFSAIRVQGLFFWRPKNIAHPKPSFWSFKSIIESHKMKVSIENLRLLTKNA